MRENLDAASLVRPVFREDSVWRLPDVALFTRN
jgi:hypothetical protein